MSFSDFQKVPTHVLKKPANLTAEINKVKREISPETIISEKGLSLYIEHYLPNSID